VTQMLGPEASWLLSNMGLPLPPLLPTRTNTLMLGCQETPGSESPQAWGEGNALHPFPDPAACSGRPWGPEQSVLWILTAGFSPRRLAFTLSPNSIHLPAFLISPRTHFFFNTD
jgi:hypothetical protein